MDKQWNFSENYFREVLLKQSWRELLGMYKADNVVKEMRKLKDGYSLTDIFGDEHKNDIKYIKYFNEIDRSTKKIKFDDI